MKRALAFLILLASALPSYSQSVYQRQTSLVDGPDCPAANVPLYRGTRGDFFGSVRIMRNMLGDEAAEYPSWALTNLLKRDSDSPYLVQDIARAKGSLAKKLDEAKKKKSYVCAMGFSVETHIVNDNKDSMGIPASLSFDVASSYATLFADTSEGSIIRVDEKYPRAGRDLYMFRSQQETEYYFPVSIPYDEITAGWTSDGVYLEKRSGTRGEAVVDVRDFNWDRRERTMDTGGKLLFSVSQCAFLDNCSSDRPDKLSGKQLTLAASVLEYLKGKPYRLVIP